jgi:3-phenylpropionate/cinnamic acid dioxygenase small subunit
MSNPIVTHLARVDAMKCHVAHYSNRGGMQYGHALGVAGRVAREGRMDGEDYFAIQNLLHSYPLLLDRGDFDGVGELFAHAIVYSGGGILADHDPKRMAKMFRDWVQTYDGSPRTRHMISNVIITPDGDGRAIVLSYVMVFQQTDAVPLQPVIGGDYRDTVAKVDGRWRFVERHMGNDLIGNLSGHGRDLATIRPSRVN